MCSLSDFESLQRSVEVADEILETHFHVPVSKALRLDDVGDFERFVAIIAAKLRRATKEAEEALMRQILLEVEVDWSKLSPTKMERVFAQVREVMTASDKVGVKAAAVLAPMAADIVSTTRQACRRVQGLHIGVNFNALDRRVIRYLKRSQDLFIHDEYGRRAVAFENQARKIVANDMAAGLGRADIARDLHLAAKTSLIEQSPYYWEIVASSFASMGRGFAQINAYAEAGIDRYIIEAVLDERTTETCRFLHGKRFSVQSAVEHFKKLESLDNPQEAKKLHPWIREGMDRETGLKSIFIQRDNKRIELAQITRSGFGVKDDVGEYRKTRSEKELAELGVGFPPYHGLCRTTTIAEIL